MQNRSFSPDAPRRGGLIGDFSSRCASGSCHLIMIMRVTNLALELARIGFYPGSRRSRYLQPFTTAVLIPSR